MQLICAFVFENNNYDNNRLNLTRVNTFSIYIYQTFYADTYSRFSHDTAQILSVLHENI